MLLTLTLTGVGLEKRSDMYSHPKYLIVQVLVLIELLLTNDTDDADLWDSLSWKWGKTKAINETHIHPKTGAMCVFDTTDSVPLSNIRVFS